MVIQAGEYKLRSFREDDAESFFDLAHDKLVKKYVPYAYPKTIEAAIEMVKDYSEGDCVNDFYLLIQRGDVYVGMIIAVRKERKELEVSAFISQEFRGKGIMTIAMKTFIKWLRDNTDYEKLMMSIKQENIASNCQIKKIGGIFTNVYKKYNVYEVAIK